MVVGEDLEPSTRFDFYREIVPRGVELLPYHRPVATTEAGIRVSEIFSGSELELPADWIVTTTAAPDDDLRAELSKSVEVVTIGDAREPERVEAAIHDAFIVASSL